MQDCKSPSAKWYGWSTWLVDYRKKRDMEAEVLNNNKMLK